MTQELTSFLSLFVSGFPDFVSSGGGMGGAGTAKDDETCSASSTSGSRMEEGPSRRDSLKVKYGKGSAPGSIDGSGLWNMYE